MWRMKNLGYMFVILTIWIVFQIANFLGAPDLRIDVN